MWLDPYIHVGPASLAAFVASIWYLGRCLKNAEVLTPRGDLIAISLLILFTGMGSIALILYGHSDLYKVDGEDYNFLTGFTVLLALPIFLYCVRRSWITPVVPKQDSQILAFMSAIAIGLGCHLTGILGYPYPETQGEPSNAWGHYGAFLLGGVHGIGSFAMFSFFESFMVFAVFNYVLIYFGFAMRPRPKPKAGAEN